MRRGEIIKVYIVIGSFNLVPCQVFPVDCDLIAIVRQQRQLVGKIIGVRRCFAGVFGLLVANVDRFQN